MKFLPAQPVPRSRYHPSDSKALNGGTVKLYSAYQEMKTQKLWTRAAGCRGPKPCPRNWFKPRSRSTDVFAGVAMRVYMSHQQKAGPLQRLDTSPCDVAPCALAKLSCCYLRVITLTDTFPKILMTRLKPNPPVALLNVLEVSSYLLKSEGNR